MKRPVAAAALLTLSFLLTARAADNAPILASNASAPATAPALPADIQQLVNQLGAEEFATRDAAAKKLAQLPPAALPHLRDVARTTRDPNVLGGLDKAIEALEIQTALAPTLVSVDDNKIYIGTIVKHIVGGEPQINSYMSSIPAGSFKIENRPMLEALTVAARQLGLKISEVSRDRSTFGFGPGFEPSTVLQLTPNALFLVHGGSIVRTRTTDVGATGKPQPNETWDLRLKIAADPHLELYRPYPRIILDKAQDDRGEAITAGDQDFSSSYRTAGAVEHRIQLTQAKAGGSRIALLKGRAIFYVVVARETVDIPAGTDVSRNIRGKIFTATWKENFRVRTATLAGRSPKGAEAWESQLAERGPENATFLDADGKVLSNEHYYGGFNPDAKQWHGQVSIPPDSKAAAFRLTLISQVQAVEVPFEFTDLPMP
jgi:hypothetical protein